MQPKIGKRKYATNDIGFWICINKLTPKMCEYFWNVPSEKQIDLK